MTPEGGDGVGVMRSKIFVAVLIVLASVARADQPAPAPQPSLTFSDNAVVVTGVAPRASVYLFGVTRENGDDTVNVVTRRTVLVDDDGDGRVEWVLERTVPLRAIWFAVDVTTGTAVCGTRPDYPATPVTLTDAHLRKKLGDSDVGQLAFPGTLIDFVVVRPGVGAWHTTAGFRGPRDEGNDEESVTVSSINLLKEPGTTAEAPQKLAKGDVVFVMNSVTAQYGMVTIGSAK